MKIFKLGFSFKKAFKKVVGGVAKVVSSVAKVAQTVVQKVVQIVNICSMSDKKEIPFIKGGIGKSASGNIFSF